MTKARLDKAIMIATIEELNNATEAYDEGTPLMTDEEWDGKYFDLVAMEKQLGYVLPNSPTQTIHFSEKVSELKKKEHNHFMLSLAKSKDISEVKSFLGDKEFLAMCKMDGLTCSLTYENGKLISAETRGNGYVGEDIFHNAMKIKTIPKHIDYKERLIVDGEIICTFEDFKDFQEEYKNPRNFAAGSIRLLDSTICEQRKLTFVAWDVIDGFNEECYKLSQKLLKIQENGFLVVPFWDSLVFDEVLIEKIQEYAELNSYPIDGIVVKFNDIDYGKSLGATAHHFNNALAYKFLDETYETKLLDIDWTMGRTGVLTPVAILEPIEIDGAEVSRASLHNVSVLKSILGNYPFYGQKVEVFKANMIIPQIKSAEKFEEMQLKEGEKIDSIPLPCICPICNKILEYKDNDGVITLNCVNPQCEGKLINKLDHFCGKKGLDIKGLSKSTLEKLVDWGWIEEIEDLFTLFQYRSQWIKKPGFGEKSVNNILTSIQNSNYVELWQVISAIGIPLIGTTVAKDLANRFKTYDAFRKAINESFDFSQIDGYGPEMMKSLLTFDYSKLDNLIDKFISIKPIEEETKNDLENLIFVITGKLKTFKNRDLLKAEIEKRGGKVSGSVSRKTDYLINNDIHSNSTKNKSAKELGVEIITEEDFINIFDI